MIKKLICTLNRKKSLLVIFEKSEWKKNALFYMNDERNAIEILTEINYEAKMKYSIL